MSMCGSEWVLRNAAHAVWSRRRAIFHAVSAASLAGNFIVLAGLLEVQWGALAGCGLLFYDKLPQLLELCEPLVQRPALFILLNLILVRVVVQSGLVGRVPMPEDSPPPDNYQIDSTFQVAADALNDFPDTETTLPASPTPTLCERPVPNYTISTPAVNIACTEPPAVTRSCRLPSNSPVVPQAAEADLYERFAVGSMKKHLLELPLPSEYSITPQQSVQRASLFTIEPLDVVTDHHHKLHGAMITQLVGGGKLERPETSHAQDVVPVPLRKVGTRAAIVLHDLGSVEESCGGHTHDDQTEALQVVKYDPDAAAHEQLDDNELSRQEFKQRVDTFICKFKRSLTMQREDSLNRLLGLLGGGEIRLIK